MLRHPAGDGFYFRQRGLRIGAPATPRGHWDVTQIGDLESGRDQTLGEASLPEPGRSVLGPDGDSAERAGHTNERY